MNFDQFEQMMNKKITNIEDALFLIPKSIQEIEQYTAWCIQLSDKTVKTFFSTPTDRMTFDTIVGVFDKLHRDFDIIESMLNLLEMTHPDKEIREVSHKSLLLLQKYAVDFFHKKEFYHVMKTYEQGACLQEQLNDEERYSLQELMRDFIREGAHLPNEQFEQVKRLEKEIAQCGLEFESNIAQDNRTISVDSNDLTGLGNEFIENLKKNESGKVLLGADYPTYFEVMQHCSNVQVRKNLFYLFNTRAYPQNMVLLDKIISLRDALAKQLKFNSYARFDLDSEMAQNVERVETFLWDLIHKAQKKAQEELALFKKDIPESVTLDDQGRIDPWSMLYLKNYYKEKYLKIDEHAVAEYFPVTKTLEGIFDVYQTFLGLTFKLFKPSWAWHDDVRVIEVHEKQSGILRGYLFIDLYPRDNKFSHACEVPMLPTVKDKKTGEILPGIATVIANFPREQKNRPALLRFDDVETFFHEFGHAMHQILGATQLASNSGTATKLDFIEMPSQMFEEWLYDKEILKKVSGHYKTGAPLSAEFIDRLVTLKKFDSGLFVLGQSLLSILCLEFFKAGAHKDTDALVRALHEKITPYIKFAEGSHFQASFGHLVGYGARYYGYLWARVFAVDIFSHIKAQGLFNPTTGVVFVKEILSKGGGFDPNVLIKNYLKRESNNKAFLENLGIA